MIQPYIIELLGGLRIRHGDQTIIRFRTQKTGALLAYLAFYLHRHHGREELIELLWPEADIESGRMSLRTALASLRRQMEPPGTPGNSVLVADRTYVRLNPEIVSTDVFALETAARESARIENPAERAILLVEAVTLYQGPLLPGFYDDWVLRERERIQVQYIETLRELVSALELSGEPGRALEYAHRVVGMDPLMEEAHCDLMRLFASTGQFAAVMRQYRELRRVLRVEMKAEPSASTRALRDRLLKARGEAAASSQCVETAAQPPFPATPVTAFSPIATPSHPAARLPLHLTRFFGREEEMDRLEQMLRSQNTRLVTLTGPGGSGKTRLALEVARRLLEEFDGAVWFIPLADISDAALIPETIIRILNLSRSAEIHPLDQLTDTLGHWSSLLVLDNFEQLVDCGSPVVRELLERIPTLSLMLTSRQRLGIEGEREYPLMPLPVPDMPGTPERLAQYASVQLFVDRAQAVRPDFQLTAQNAVAVAALCERLEGIPLAMELAAAWAQMLTPAQMLDRVSHRFDLLTSRRKDLAPRHRTLRAAIEWSYRLLPDTLQRLFVRLSVFRGGWTLDAAGRICSDPVSTDRKALMEGTLELLYELQGRSLIMTEEAGEEMRFRLLEMLREYASEQMPSKEREALEARHAVYFLQLAEEAETSLRGPEQAAWRERLERDRDNVRAALERCLSRGDVETGLRLAGAMVEFWQAGGYGDEGLRWLEDLLAQGSEVPAQLRAKALCGIGELLQYRLADETVIARFEQSLQLYRELGDKRAMAAVLRKMSSPVYLRSRKTTPATALLEESLSLSREVGDMPGIAESLQFMGNLARDRGDYTLAESFYSQSLALCRQIGDLHGVVTLLAEMGYMLNARNEFDRAEALLQENLDLSRRLKDRHSTTHAFWLLGRLMQDRGDYGAAEAFLQEGLALAQLTGVRQQTVNCLVNLGMVMAHQDNHAKARPFYAEALSLTRELGSRIGLVFPLWLDGRAAYHNGEYRAARLRYRECLAIVHERASLPETITCLRMLAQAYQADGHVEQAARLFGAAEAACDTSPERIAPFDPTEYAHSVEAVRTALGEEAFREAWCQGRAIGLDQAVEEVLMPE